MKKNTMEKNTMEKNTMKKNTMEKKQTKSLLKSNKGLSTVEYIIILVLIAVAGIALWRGFGEVVSEKIAQATSDVGAM